MLLLNIVLKYVFPPQTEDKEIIIHRESEENDMNNKFLTSILLNAEQICNSKDLSVLLVAVKEGAEYKDGKPTGNIDHYKHDIVLPFNQFEKITVKVKGAPIVTQEQIDQKGGSMKIRFKNLTGKFYRTGNGDYALSASADGLEVIT